MKAAVILKGFTGLNTVRAYVSIDHSLTPTHKNVSHRNSTLRDLNPGISSDIGVKIFPVLKKKLKSKPCKS